MRVFFPCYACVLLYSAHYGTTRLDHTVTTSLKKNNPSLSFLELSMILPSPWFYLIALEWQATIVCRPMLHYRTSGLFPFICFFLYQMDGFFFPASLARGFFCCLSLTHLPLQPSQLLFLPLLLLGGPLWLHAWYAITDLLLYFFSGWSCSAWWQVVQVCHWHKEYLIIIIIRGPVIGVQTFPRCRSLGSPGAW